MLQNKKLYSKPEDVFSSILLLSGFSSLTFKAAEVGLPSTVHLPVLLVVAVLPDVNCYKLKKNEIEIEVETSF